MKFVQLIKKYSRPRGKTDFLSRLDPESKILDVGCGNNPLFKTKEILSDCIYMGLDIQDDNRSRPIPLDSVVVTSKQNFCAELAKFTKTFDVVVSSHNLEHCNDREGVLLAMLEALKIGGKLFLSFPCEQSVGFPSRRGTLCYFDDPTHQFGPPKFNEIIACMCHKGFEICYAEKNYSPQLLRSIGFVCEPISKLRNKTMIGTWEYYGFESIIIARRIR